MNNQEEILKFTQKAEEWWDLNGAFKLLHDINKVRVSYIYEKIKLHFCDKENIISILDVGCGGGLACEALYRLMENDGYKFEICGIDPGLENIEIAKIHASQSNLNIDYFHSSIEDFSTERTFDVVISLEVIEHTENYIHFLQKLSSLLNMNDGLLFLSTINKTIKSYFQAIILAEYVLKWLPKKTHDWKKFLKPSEIEIILRKKNVYIEDISGFKFNALKKNWYLGEDVDVNYILYGIAKQ